MPSSPLDRVVVESSSSSPLGPRRVVVATPTPPTHHIITITVVSPQSLSPALRCTPVHPRCRQRPRPCRSRGCPPAARPPSSRLSPLRRRVIARRVVLAVPVVRVRQSSEANPSRAFAAERRPRRAPPVTTRRPCVVAVVGRCRRRRHRHRCLRRRHRRRRHRRQHSRPRVALPL